MTELALATPATTGVFLNATRSAWNCFGSMPFGVQIDSAICGEVSRRTG
jgi:hypothetical protein